MMDGEYYPYISSGIYLNDAIFLQYGGETGTSTASQRQAAYVMAEHAITRHIRTFLIPTIVTGTYYVSPYPVYTYWNRVNRIISATFLDYDGTATLKDDATDIFFIRDDTYGVLDIIRDSACFYRTCNYLGINPYQIRIVYQAGLGVGVFSNPTYLMAGVMVADARLKEITDPFALEGGSGDPGIDVWSSQGYSERRVISSLGATALGNSPRMNTAARMLESLKVRKAMRL